MIGAIAAAQEERNERREGGGRWHWWGAGARAEERPQTQLRSETEWAGTSDVPATSTPRIKVKVLMGLEGKKRKKMRATKEDKNKAEICQGGEKRENLLVKMIRKGWEEKNKGKTETEGKERGAFPSHGGQKTGQ